MTIPPDHPARALHDHYQRLTGFRVTLSYQRLLAWKEYLDRGLTADDLALVIRWLRRQIQDPQSHYTPASLQFSSLIQDVDRFEDKLNLAREAWRRRPAPSPPPSQPPKPPHSTPPQPEESMSEEDIRAYFRSRLAEAGLNLPAP